MLYILWEKNCWATLIRFGAGGCRIVASPCKLANCLDCRNVTKMYLYTCNHHNFDRWVALCLSQTYQRISTNIHAWPHLIPIMVLAQASGVQVTMMCSRTGDSGTRLTQLCLIPLSDTPFPDPGQSRFNPVITRQENGTNSCYTY